MKIIPTLILVIFSSTVMAQNWLDKKCPNLDKQINIIDFESSKERNVLDILINQSDEIVVNGEEMPRLNSEIAFKEYILDYITNPDNLKTKSESPGKVFVKLYSYNKATTKLEKLNIYIKEVYLYLWNSEGQTKYKSAYADLSCKKREKIFNSFPLRIVSEESANSNQKKPRNRVGIPPFGGDVKK